MPTVTTQEFESSCEVNEKGRRVINEGKDSRSLNIARLASMNMLPTPIAGDWEGQLRSDGTASMLSGKASLGLLPTPMAQERKTDLEKTLERKEKYGGVKRSMYLENYAAMGMLPTPQASEGTKIGGTENQDSLTKRARQFSGNSSKLNPQFVAEMMGFPNNWTEKPFQDTDEKSFDVVDFDDFPTSYPIVQEEFQPNDMTHSKWRRESIKGYGNAVVPTVVLEIFKAIEKYDKFTKS